MKTNFLFPNRFRIIEWLLLIPTTILESLMWATYVTFAIQIFCLLFFYEFKFFLSMIINMFTILIVFIIRYNFIIFRSKIQSNEK